MGGVYFPSWLYNQVGDQWLYTHKAKPEHSHYSEGAAG